MKRKSLFKIIIPAICAIILTVLVYGYLKNLFVQFYLSSDADVQIRDQYVSNVHYELFLTCFAIIYTTIALPFIFAVFRNPLKVTRKNLGKIVLILEVIGLLLAYMLTPPDTMSTFLLFIVWQVPVLVNILTISILARKS